MKNEQTVVERIYEQLEAGNLELVLQLKDKLLSLEQIDLKIQYEKGELAGIYKTISINGK
jgi:hypothetical protein